MEAELSKIRACFRNIQTVIEMQEPLRVRLAWVAAWAQEGLELVDGLLLLESTKGLADGELQELVERKEGI